MPTTFSGLLVVAANCQFGILKSDSGRFEFASMPRHVVVQRSCLHARLHRRGRRVDEIPYVSVMLREFSRVYGPAVQFFLCQRLDYSSPYITEAALGE